MHRWGTATPEFILLQCWDQKHKNGDMTAGAPGPDAPVPKGQPHPAEAHTEAGQRPLARGQGSQTHEGSPGWRAGRACSLPERVPSLRAGGQTGTVWPSSAQ